MKRSLICLLVAMVGAIGASAEERHHAPAVADDARFEFLKSLQGNWDGQGLDDKPGGVYEFAVTVHPNRGSYDAWMSDGTTSFSASELTFRNGGTGAFDWLHFGGSISSADDDWRFSLDSVLIEYVPEPATTVLLLFGVAVLAPVRRKRR